MTARFWSDDFDMDLLKLFPDLPDRLGPMADVKLWTYGGESHGRLNHPSAWNGYTGMEAFFGTDNSGRWKPSECRTSWPMVECTWLEALRDAWPHAYLLHVDGNPILDTNQLQPAFQKLMYALRGWTSRADRDEVDKLRSKVLVSLLHATEDLELLVEFGPDDRVLDLLDGES